MFSKQRYDFSEADIILTLASPSDEEIKLLSKSQMLIAMLHYSTHPLRNKLLNDQGVLAVSLDEIKDDEGRRFIQDYSHAAYNAVTEGYIQLRQAVGDKYWFSKRRGQFSVYQIGFGELGKYVTEAALKMGRTGFLQEIRSKGANPLVEVIPISSTHSVYKFYLNKIISRSLNENGCPHLLIDVSQRTNLSKAIITEETIKLLPRETVLVDISADRYEGSQVVKGIQGIPTGNELHYHFSPEDAFWNDEKMIPLQYQLKKENRRNVVSHYAWPSYGTYKDRIRNIDKYGRQLFPIIKNIIRNG